MIQSCGNETFLGLDTKARVVDNLQPSIYQESLQAPTVFNFQPSVKAKYVPTDISDKEQIFRSRKLPLTLDIKI